jgi:hypothetical protein
MNQADFLRNYKARKSALVNNESSEARHNPVASDDRVNELLSILNQPKQKGWRSKPVPTSDEKLERRRAERRQQDRLYKLVDSVPTSKLRKSGSDPYHRFVAIAECRAKGKSWDDIASLFNFPTARHAIEGYRKLSETYSVSETAKEVRQIHDARLEQMFQALVPAMEAENKGTPRAVEVGIKVLERQARLHGADAIEEASIERGDANVQQQGVVINITAHPGDSEAQRLVIEGGGGQVGGGEGAGQVLPPSNQSLPEPEENNLPGGRDG